MGQVSAQKDHEQGSFEAAPGCGQIEVDKSKSQKMIVAIAHCLKESEQAKRLAAWMAELGPYPNHRLLVGRDARAEPNLFANSGFGSIEEITIIGDAWNHWPESCNNALRQIGKHVEFTSKEPWLWCEVDAIPLKSDWLDLIEAEYRQFSKPFLGDFVHVPEMMNVPDHMSGVAVYPGSLSHFAGDAYLAHELAWDCAAASQIVPQMHKSKHILHRWKHFAFETWEQVQQAIFDVKPEAALFHSDKTGSLIGLLRERLSGEVPIGGSGIHGIKCTCLERDFPCPFHFRDNQSESASTAITPVIAELNGDSRESIVRDTVALLKQLCTAPRHISQVRKELKAQGVTR